jgi:hypothetical protein
MSYPTIETGSGGANAGTEDRNTDAAPLINLEGVGVRADELKRWNAAKDRFMFGSNRIDLVTFPRSEEAIRFYRGESEYDVAKGEFNLTNNPLGLIRPTTLHSVTSLPYYNGDTWVNVNIQSHDMSTSFKDREYERKYARLVAGFERVSVAVLEGLNEINPETRRNTVKKALDLEFGGGDGVRSYLYSDASKDSPAESPPSWLLYAVISILHSPSDQITAAGRLRSLELLQLYSTKELADGFRNERKNNQYYNGYDRIHTPRIPYTFCTREERLEKNHKDIWERNKNIQELMITDAKGRIDWASTVNGIIEKSPEEAVQIALLFLHGSQTTEGGIALLRQIPLLGHEVKSRMFGKKATFIIEHALADTVDELVSQGAGIAGMPGFETEDISGLSREEILQMLRRKDLRNREQEEALVLAEARGAELAWKVRDLEGELMYWRAGKKPQTWVEKSADKTDPKGFFRALGLHPNAFEGLTEDDILELLNRHHRFYAARFHSDKGHKDDTRIKQINAGYDTLKDPEKRKGYLKA